MKLIWFLCGKLSIRFYKNFSNFLILSGDMQISAFTLVMVAVAAAATNDECSFDRHWYVRNWFLYGANGFCFVQWMVWTWISLVQSIISILSPAQKCRSFSFFSLSLNFPSVFYSNLKLKPHAAWSAVVHTETNNISNTN